MSENAFSNFANTALAKRVVLRRTRLEFARKKDHPEAIMNFTTDIAESVETEWMRRFPQPTSESHALLKDARVSLLVEEMYDRAYVEGRMRYLNAIRSKAEKMGYREEAIALINKGIADVPKNGEPEFLEFLLEYLQLSDEEVRKAIVKVAKKISAIEKDQFVIDLILWGARQEDEP